MAVPCRVGPVGGVVDERVSHPAELDAMTRCFHDCFNVNVNVGGRGNLAAAAAATTGTGTGTGTVSPLVAAAVPWATAAASAGTTALESVFYHTWTGLCTLFYVHVCRRKYFLRKRKKDEDNSKLDSVRTNNLLWGS